MIKVNKAKSSEEFYIKISQIDDIFDISLNCLLSMQLYNKNGFSNILYTKFMTKTRNLVVGFK